MIKFVTALIASLAAGWLLAGTSTPASARCMACGGGPLPTLTYYKTVHPTQFRTQYHDVSVYRHVPRIRQIMNVTRVQPIIRIHDVTRVHHRTIFYTQNVYATATQNLAPITYVDRSIMNTYDCGCGY